ncbi:unnamed protein product [Pedinophyceae sp. YPF-701]|nr:unnamed protein product [Pedinophyceae sp. YPF-701]
MALDARRNAGLQLADVLLVPGLLDKLAADDTKNLAAASWGTLEAVLRGTTARLRVHPSEPVLWGLARRAAATAAGGSGSGDAAGGLVYCGVRVSAADAAAFLEALREVRADDPGRQGRDISFAQWAKFVRSLVTAGQGAVRVTGLGVPLSFDRGAARDADAALQAMALQTILAAPAVRAHLRSLTLNGVCARDWEVFKEYEDALRGLPSLARLTIIHDGGGRCDGGAAVRLARGCPGLRQLRLRGFTFDRAGVQMLRAWLARATHLKAIKLTCCAAEGENGWGAEDEPPLAPHLESFKVVEACDLHSVGAWFGPKLRSLHLRNWNGLTADGCRPVAEDVKLAELIRRSTTLQHLSVVGAPLGIEGTLAIMSALAANRSLTSVCLPTTWGADNVEAGVSDAIVRVVLRHPTLESLSLQMPAMDRIALNGADLAAAVDRNRSLREINFSGISVNHDGAEALGAILRNNDRLVKLSLADCNMSARAMEGLARGLGGGMSALHTLDLSGSSISAGGIAALARSKLMSVITCLSLSFCEIQTPAVLESLADSLADERCTLRELDLSRNQICRRGALLLARALEMNKSLVHVDLKHNKLGRGGVEALLQHARTSPTLWSLDLEGNGVEPAELVYLYREHLGGPQPRMWRPSLELNTCRPDLAVKL